MLVQVRPLMAITGIEYLSFFFFLAMSLGSCETHSAVVPDACSLPAAVVSTGVALVELEAVVFIPAHVEQRDTKWPFSLKTSTHANAWVTHDVALDQISEVFIFDVKTLRMRVKGLSCLYLQTGCRPAWCHTKWWPAAHRGWVPDTAASTWWSSSILMSFSVPQRIKKSQKQTEHVKL